LTLVVGVLVCCVAEVRAEPKPPITAKTVTPEQRIEMLSRASVWRPPQSAISKARFGTDSNSKALACRFEVTELSGTARKFDCRDEQGNRLRVKYGGSPEIPSEVASARLLHALGFGADRMTLVEKLRCHGCPSDPFVVLKAVDLTRVDEIYKKLVDYATYTDFEWVAVERRHNGRAIESKDLKGWAFFELQTIESRKGGAPRAHVDALRLLAVFLAHWDNKTDNQRLVCLSELDWPSNRTCRQPFAMLQDLGASFGPRKVDLDGWQQVPIWKDRGRCIVDMQSLPYNGGTFEAAQISEAGRRHLATLLTQLTDRQVSDLFSGARFDRRDESLFGAAVRPAEHWARIFKEKVRQINEGPACPQ
jgi:hypothetical protein